MAKKKTRTSKVSMGGRQKANLKKHEKRMAKFAAKRELGNAYEYKPNPYKPGTVEYEHERMDRAEKAKSSRLEIAQWTSTMSMLTKELAHQKEIARERLKAVKVREEKAS